MDKKHIKKSFSRAANTYEESSIVQREVARELAGLAASLNGALRPGPKALRKMILDIGCGTGSLARLLHGVYPGSFVAGLDLSLKMALKAKKNLNGAGAGLIAADCEGLPLAASSFDLAASSLTFQWAPDTKSAFNETARVLKPGGLFCISTLGPGTLCELEESRAEAFAAKGLRAPGLRPYKHTRELTIELKEAGFEVVRAEGRPIVKRYDDLFALLRTLKNIGAFRRAEPEEDKTLAAGLLREVSRVYSERFPAPGPSGGVTATYQVVYIIAKKPA